MIALDRPVIAAAVANAFPESGTDAVHIAEVIGSTSDEATARARVGAPHGTVVLAESQTAGRGRRGTQWVAPARANILLSIVLRPALSRAIWPRLTHLAGLAVADAIESQTGLRAQLKWPNDIYLAGRKVAGILLDAYPSGVEGGFAIAGIGLNANMARDDFPPDLEETATALSIETGSAIDRSALAAGVIRCAARRFAGAGDPDRWITALRELRQRSLLHGKLISAALPGGSRLDGTVSGLGPEGELLVTDASGQIATVASADFVRLR